MDLEPHPIDEQYLEVLRKMTREQRWMKTIELTAQAQQAARESMRIRFPELSETEIHQLYLAQQIESSRQKALIASGAFERSGRSTD